MANGNETEAHAMADVQRAIALLLTGTFCAIVVVMVTRVTYWGQPADVMDLLKIVIPATITLVTGATAFYYGSSKAKETSDASQQRVMDKLTSTPPGSLPPTPGTPVSPWWSRLNDVEKNAITTASSTDPRVAAFVTASQVGAATKDDLDYLVAKGLVTSDRAKEISA